MWMVFTCSLILKTSSPFTNHWGSYLVPQLQLVLPSPTCFIFFNCLQARSKYLYLISLSFIFTLWFVGTATSTFPQVLFFLIFIFGDCHYICSSDRDFLIRFYLKIKVKFVLLIILERFFVRTSLFVRSDLNYFCMIQVN